MYHAHLDASALAKRYVIEVGSAGVNHLFHSIPADRLIVLNVGMAEVFSVLVRQRNGRRISKTSFDQAHAEFLREIVLAPAVRKVVTDNALVEKALPLIETYSINSTDAIVLRSALDRAVQLRGIGDDLFLTTCDRRLIAAAQAEGLATFDPELEPPAALDALLGP